jgi:hypothetical protein
VGDIPKKARLQLVTQVVEGYLGKVLSPHHPKALPITKNMFLAKSFRLKVGIVLGTFIRIEIGLGILI